VLGQVIRYDSSQHRSVPIKIRPKNTIFIGQKRKNSPVFSKYTDKPLPISKIITYFASQNKKQSARATLPGIYNVARSDYTAKNTNEP
jgi:hypothetical protein